MQCFEHLFLKHVLHFCNQFLLMFGRVWIYSLFENTTVSNIEGIRLNNFEGIYCWDAKTGQGFDVFFNILDNWGVNWCPRRRIALKSFKKRLTLFPKTDRILQHSLVILRTFWVGFCQGFHLGIYQRTELLDLMGWFWPDRYCNQGIKSWFETI